MKIERVKEFKTKLEDLLDDYSDVVYKELADIIRDVAELVKRLNE